MSETIPPNYPCLAEWAEEYSRDAMTEERVHELGEQAKRLLGDRWLRFLLATIEAEQVQRIFSLPQGEERDQGHNLVRAIGMLRNQIEEYASLAESPIDRRPRRG